MYPVLRPTRFGLADRGLFTGSVQVRLANVVGNWLEDGKIEPPMVGEVDFWRDNVPADRTRAR